MKKYLTRMNVRTSQRGGQGMTEYVLILSTVAVVGLLGYVGFGNWLLGLLNSIVAAI